MKETARSLDSANESLRKYAKPTIPVGEEGEAVWPAYYLARDIAPVVHQKNALRALNFPPYTGGYRCELKLDPDDFEKLRNWRNIIDLIHFDAWFTIVFNSFFKDPIKLQWLRKIYPAYFEAREKEIQYMAKLKKEMLKVTINGATTKKELDFLYWLNKNPKAREFINKNITMETVVDDLRNIQTIIDGTAYKEGILFKALGRFRKAGAEWGQMFAAGEKILSGDIPWDTLKDIYSLIRNYSHMIFVSQERKAVIDPMKALKYKSPETGLFQEQTYKSLMGILVPEMNIDLKRASETPVFREPTVPLKT